ncbi:hypothetical protein F5876DRAFT_83410 [Lentinula aff. lateritia]|uniref:Uncharacterized protein n=1 Tax=Lentinula aff. lateritia TaxID=2804960 RepID=A0ACC1TI44_9AGAR|nr:hypothetical protein F5876DRAFT_83410 [Lentinula aff. lateritia]
MGTNGYRVYYFNGFYFLYYSHYDSYPRGLGVEFSNEIPSDPDEYQTYVATKKAELQSLLTHHDLLDLGYTQTWEDEEDPDGSSIDRLSVMKTPPRLSMAGFRVDYIYEIDLEHHIFCIDGEPLFDTRNMPHGDEFLLYLGTDLYDRICFSKTTPERHRFKLPPPATVDCDILDTYDGYNVQCIPDPHTLLRLPVNLRPVEQTRIRIMQIFIASLMLSMCNQEGFGIRAVLSHSVLNIIPTKLRIICEMFSNALLYAEEWRYSDSVYEDCHSTQPWRWILEEELCLLVVPRLDSESLLRAAIVELVQAVTSYFGTEINSESAATGTSFHGVIMSLYHISVVRFEVVNSRENIQFRVEHSPYMRFLPEDHCCRQDTPGITALSRLGQILHENTLRHKLFTKNAAYHKAAARNTSKFGEIPLEIAHNIAQHLPPYYLRFFATISPACAGAAFEFLLHPHFRDGSLANTMAYRFQLFQLNSLKENSVLLQSHECSWYRVLPICGPEVVLPTDSEEGEDDDEDRISTLSYRDLYFATFFAIDENGEQIKFLLTALPRGFQPRFAFRRLQDHDMAKENYLGMRRARYFWGEFDVAFAVGRRWCESVL